MDKGDTTEIRKTDVADILSRLTTIDNDNKTIILVLKGNPDYKQPGIVDILQEHKTILSAHAETLAEVKKIGEHTEQIKQLSDKVEKHGFNFRVMAIVGGALLAFKDQIFIAVTELFKSKP